MSVKVACKPKLYDYCNVEEMYYYWAIVHRSKYIMLICESGGAERRRIFSEK